jgi:hypothetical protein
LQVFNDNIMAIATTGNVCAIIILTLLLPSVCIDKTAYCTIMIYDCMLKWLPPPLSRPLQVFNDNSRIVAIATTGNVYAAEAVEELNIKAKNFEDLMTSKHSEDVVPSLILLVCVCIHIYVNLIQTVKELNTKAKNFEDLMTRFTAYFFTAGRDSLRVFWG